MMRRRTRKLIRLTGAIGLAGLLAPAPHLAHAASQQGECTPLVVFHAEIKTCYLPAHRAVAEHRLSPHPINPIPTLTRLTHLPLNQVIVLSGTGRGTPGPAISIVYVFGTPTNKVCSPGHRRAGIPLYVIVQETVGHIAVKGMQVENTGDVPGPWSLYANIPGRNLSLHVVSNAVSERLPLEIGQGILQAAK